MRYYYTDAANQPAGPCDLDQLKALAAEGKINDSTSVIPEGGQNWTTYAAIIGVNPLPYAAAPAARPSPNLTGIPTILGDNVGRMLGKVSGWLSPQLLQNSLRGAGHYGHFAVVAGAVFGLILAAVQASRMHMASVFFFGGIGFVIAVAIAQFSAQRFMSAGARIIATTPNQLSSKSFLECVGLFALLFALGALLLGIAGSFQSNSMAPLIPALLLTAYFVYFATAALHPEELNVNIAGEATAGEEAIAILAFFCKVGLKLAPLFFFLLAVAGAVLTLLAIFDIGQSATGALMMAVPFLAVLGQGMEGGSSISPAPMLVLIACLVPVLTYFFFLIWYLFLDLMRAILAVPAKLDALKKS
ncbi:MAG: hypothetical protein JWM32_1914 [Verrucomicrobia bacterium]|nr:hypothetical protein [Verrucomicrobiota bacterium]